MNTRQNKHVRMFSNTQNTLDKNTTLWNTIPVITRLKNRMDELLQMIREQNRKTNPESEAITTDKDDIRVGLSIKAASVSGILQTYATIIGDSVLQDKVKLRKSDITSCREQEVDTLTKPIIEEARKNLTELEEYDLTEDMLVDLETSLDDYNEMIGSPQRIRNRAFAAKTVLQDLIDEVNSLLNDKLDNMMLRFEFSEPEFYDEYRRNRAIYD